MSWAGVTERRIATNGIELNIAEAGKGPLVLLLHGFPESWYSWRHQFAPLAAAGYHVVAPDMRGYGKSDKPAQASASDYSAEVAELSKDRAKFKDVVSECDQAINARMKAGDYSRDARCAALAAAFYSSSEHKGYKGGWK